MNLEEFRRDALQSAYIDAAVNLEFNSVEYLGTVVRDLIEFDECTDYTPCYYEGSDKKGKKIKIFGYNYDEDDCTLSIFSCSYSGRDEISTITQTEINRIYERAKSFVTESFSGTIQEYADESTQAYELACLISSIQHEIERYRFYIITDSQKSERIKTLSVDPIGDKPVVISLWDITNYFDLKVSKMGYDDVEIDFASFGVEGIPCLKVSEDVAGDNYDAYLCVMPGLLLAQLYEKYGGRLLEANVRSFLKLTTKTNKGIKATILKEPHMFFAFNNGITTTATDIRVKDGPIGKIMTGATSLQIVNGGQTTATIYAVSKSKENPDIHSVYVPMKISVIPPKSAEELVPKISRSANTQNKVSEADFFSNHPFHRQMELLSRKIRAPALHGRPYATHWFYERARGQYLQEQANLTPSEKKKFLIENPKSQYFTKTDLAKFRNSYERLPHIVSMGAQASFMRYAKDVSDEWEKNSVAFNEIYYKESIALAIIFRGTESLVSEQPWYNGGYRANIVTYSIAKLADLIEDNGRKLDLLKIWEEQAMDGALKEQLIEICEQVYNSITASNPVVQNVTQWCKKPACWDRVKSLRMELSPEIDKCLISENKERFRQRGARIHQKEVDKMNARIDVVNAGGQYWRSLYEWGVDHNLLNAIDKSMLKAAFEIEDRILPSEKQSIEIIKIRDRLREDGYRH